MPGSAIILGAGQIGIAVAEALATNGWSVRLAARSAPARRSALTAQGVSFVRANRDGGGALQAVIGPGADLLVDTIAFHGDHARQLLQAGSGFGQLVVVSSASVYCDAQGRTLDEADANGFPVFAGPITEHQATVPPGPETYSTQKVELERTLLDHGTVPVTILRPCAIHGAGSRAPREWWFVKRLRDGRSVIPLAYNGDSRFHTTAVANIAALVLAIADKPATRILNTVDPEVFSVRDIGASIAAEMGRDVRLLGVAGRDVGRTPWSVPLPFVLDDAAARATGYAPVGGYRTLVAAAVQDLMTADLSDAGWKQAFPVLAGYAGEMFDYAAEDAWLAAPAAR